MPLGYDILTSLYVDSLCRFTFSLSFSLVGCSILLLKPLIFLSDLIELSHVLKEILASLESDEKFGLFAIPFLALDCNCFGSDLFEGCILVSNKIFRSNDTCGDCISESMELDCLVSLKVLLAKEDVEVGILFD